MTSKKTEPKIGPAIPIHERWASDVHNPLTLQEFEWEDETTLAQTNKAILPDRLWSFLETGLVTLVQQALKQQLEMLIQNASATMMSDQTLWRMLSDYMRTTLSSAFAQIAEQAAADTMKMLSKSEVGVSFQLMNQSAQSWAQAYAATQITNIDDTTKDAVRLAISDWMNQGRDQGVAGLKSRLMNLTDKTGVPLFGEQRAERIARSEITSVYAGGTAASLQSIGYPPAVFRPRAHVNCRCYIQPGVMASGEKVIVWYTVRDEMVCTREIVTPWGTVEGCKELHRTIVSEGRAGEKWTGNLWNPEKLR